MQITKLEASFPDGTPIGQWLYPSEEEAEKATSALAKMLRLDVIGSMATVEIPITFGEETGGVTTIKVELPPEKPAPPKPTPPPSPKIAIFQTNFSRN